MSDIPDPLTVGTAGHVDHGKSALVHALTGAPTDRLREERERGMTITLGYARLTLPGGRALSLIDVPGHERLLRVMVAGAGGIDMFLLAVAADDGIMPQTREHLRVLRALDVRAGVVAVTKCDLADPGPATAALRELLPAVPVVACSVRTGDGIAELAAALETTAAPIRSRALARGPCVLHIDRVFSIRGAGTVVTGTLWSGSIARGERLVLLPRGRAVRVRGVQVHDEPRAPAHAGQRVAVNLTGVSREEVDRGDVLSCSDSGLAASHMLDCELELELERPSGAARVHVHHGTRESAARLVALGGEMWQLRLERPLLARAGDRVVVRSISVPDTLGGGVVVDPHARRHGPSPAVVERLERLRRGETPTQPPSGQPSNTGARPGVTPAAMSPLSASALALERRLREAGVQPPGEHELGADARHLGELRAAGRAVRVGRSMYAHADAIAEVRERASALIAAEGSITLARLRDELGISRRHAQALLEHLDAVRVTLRLEDDRRVLRRDR